ncbi:cytochrome P450 [Polyplosphaeria fusca]|uniref:Cytochrome P450 n=1 Tax=Polyplosphaeria fusca TaxID=682080 RepID=A0A9P4QMM4_9PLEO|nr:cytochrome P450 [Polyplosphaeria fusca]
MAFSRGLVLAAIVSCYIVYVYLRRKRQRKADKIFGAQNGCLPMEVMLPYKWPFALDVLKKQYDALPSQRLLAFQSQYFDRLGPNFKLMLFGNEGYMTTDPKNIEAVLSTRFEDWVMGSRSAGLYPMLGEGIFTQDGRPWKHSRELLRRQFVRIQYQKLDVFDNHVNELLNGLASAPDTIVDMQPYFFRFTLATTTDLLFGETEGVLTNDVEDAFASSFDYASLISAIRLRLADLHFLYKPKKFRNACGVIKSYADHFVSRALKTLEQEGEEIALSRYPFILDLYNDMKDAKLVRDQLMHVLIAGRDTTACLMSWTFYLLVRHPTVLKRLQKEIASVVSGNERNVTRAQIAQIPYLRYVLNETLRLYPQLPVNVRIAAKTTLLPSGGGPHGTAPVLMPKGTGVAWSAYHMHRMTRLYGPNAREFDPERWENTDLERQIGWGFLPFHGGPRLCLGKDFALTEASYAVVRIVQAFPGLRLPPTGVENKPTGEERQNLTIVVSSADGCKVLLR